MSEHQWVAVVEDDESLRTSLVRLLRVVGMDTCGFCSAESFLGRADDSDPACAVLDIRLGPGLNGYQLKERLESEGRRFPIIFMTGDAELAMLARSAPDTSTICLLKPFEQDELVAHLRHLLGELTEAHASSAIAELRV